MKKFFDSLEMPTYLHWSQRPKAVQYAIDAAYDKICNDPTSNWGAFNGQEVYNLAGIDDHALVEKILLAGLARGQTRFHLLDIGAGNFQWGLAVSEFINSNPLLKQVEHVSVISLSGENHVLATKAEGRKVGICTLYEYGNFKVENLIDEFKSTGHELVNRVDLIVSSWALRHCADPTGTLLQAYSLLRPTAGLLLFDGFFIETDDELKHLSEYDSLTLLLLSFEAPFYRYMRKENYRLDCFVLQKTTAMPNIPLSYAGSISNTDGEMWQIGSGCITRFKPTAGWNRSIKVASWHRQGVLNFACYSDKGAELLKYILEDDTLQSSHQSKIITLFTEIDSLDEEARKKRDQEIFGLLKELISKKWVDGIGFKEDHKVAWACIQKMVDINKQHAIKTLNLIAESGDTLLNHCTTVTTAHEFLLEIAPPSVLNSRYSGGESHLMTQIYFRNYGVVQRLLEHPDVDVAVMSAGESALTLLQKRINVLDRLVAREEKSCKSTEADIQQKLLQKAKMSEADWDAIERKSYVTLQDEETLLAQHQRELNEYREEYEVVRRLEQTLHSRLGMLQDLDKSVVSRGMI